MQLDSWTRGGSPNRNATPTGVHPISNPSGMVDCSSEATTVSYSPSRRDSGTEREVLLEGRTLRIDVSADEEAASVSSVPTERWPGMALMARGRNRLLRRLRSETRSNVALGTHRQHWQELVVQVSVLALPGDPGWGAEEGCLLSSGEMAGSERGSGSESDSTRHSPREDEVFPVLDTGVFEEWAGGVWQV